jgi:Predicted O-methyltransferase
MANRSLPLDDALYSYLLRVGVREPDVLARLRRASDREEMAIMRSAPEQGQFMAMLLKLMEAGRVLEIGTYTGYATLWMALALPRDGEIATCDISETWTAVGRRYWRLAGVEERVRLVLQPALMTLDALLAEGQRESFDFAFIDADKENYPAYYERCLELVRRGGLICIDNVLWGGAVADPKRRDGATRAIRAFNAALKRDRRVEIAMLPVADGLTLARKLPLHRRRR